ncbi:MAG TPA: terminase family protein, partial [Acidimicrobiia bacterium]|nr:terminase family protein [Acidimicrobiia bacterium]
AYRDVIVTVPRQSGKTTLVLGWEIQRAHGWDTPQRIVYSAQSGNDARKKLIEDQVPILEPRRKRLGIRRILRGMGNEAIEFANGSRLVLLASTADSGHGKTIDLGVKDELFADYDDRRDQALIPAMATRAAAQILTMSTMGTDESFPLNRAVERGRQAVAAGTNSGIAYFEWSADPDEDADDPATWRRCMPALGWTQTEAVIVQARSSMSDGEFRRAFLNQQTKAEDRVIPGVSWAAVCDDNVAPSGQLVFSLDVNPERNAGAIVAAAGGVAELVDYRPSIGWMVGRAKALTDRHAARWVVEAAGPAGSLIPDLENAGLTVHPVTPREMVEACGQFYDGVMDSKIRIRRHPKLDEAVAGAAKRTVGDAWAWTRKNATTDVCPLVALTLALWARDLGVSVYEEDRGLLVL